MLVMQGRCKANKRLLLSRLSSARAASRTEGAVMERQLRLMRTG